MGGMRPVVALYSTFLQRAFDQTVHDVCQNDQPVADRGRPGRARRRGRDQPPGHVHAAGPAPAAEPRHRLARRTSRSCARCSGRRSRRTTRSRCTTRVTRASGCRAVEPADPADRARRGRCARAATSCSSASGRSWCGRWRPPTALEADGWSIGVINARFAKPLDRQLILDAGPRQAAGRDVRGERRRPAASASGVLEIDRGSAARGSGATATSPCGSSASPATFRRPRLGGRPAPDAASGCAGSCRAGARDPDAAQAFAWTVDLGRRLNPP